MDDTTSDKLTLVQKRWQICINCLDRATDGRRQFFLLPIQERDANAPWYNVLETQPPHFCERCAFTMEHVVLAGEITERWFKYYDRWMGCCSTCENRQYHSAKLSILTMMRNKFGPVPQQELLRTCIGCHRKMELKSINQEFADVLPRPRTE